jgi:hypothetical protein
MEAIEVDVLMKVDDLLKGLKAGTVKLDHVKIPTLQKLHRNLERRQEAMLDLVVTTRAMQSALATEIYKMGGSVW